MPIFRRSHLLIPTLRDVPSDAFTESHRMLLRGGYMRQLFNERAVLAATTRERRARWSALSTLRCIASEAAKSPPPYLTCGTLKTTGRWESTGEELFRLKDRGRPKCVSRQRMRKQSQPLSQPTPLPGASPPENIPDWEKYRDEVSTKIWAIASSVNLS